MNTCFRSGPFTVVLSSSVSVCVCWCRTGSDSFFWTVETIRFTLVSVNPKWKRWLWNLFGIIPNEVDWCCCCRSVLGLLAGILLCSWDIHMISLSFWSRIEWERKSEGVCAAAIIALIFLWLFSDALQCTMTA